MPSIKSDPLLSLCKLVAWLILLGLCAAIALMIAFAGAALFDGAWFETVMRQSYPQLQHGMAPLFALAMALIAVAIGITIRFMLLLLAIIRSVQAGEAFTLANSRRIRLMAWLSLAVFPVGICLAAVLGSLVNQLGPAAADAGIHVQSFDGLGLGLGQALMTLLLFVLARLFAQAAAMRDEIEGTV